MLKASILQCLRKSDEHPTINIGELFDKARKKIDPPIQKIPMPIPVPIVVKEPIVPQEEPKPSESMEQQLLAEELKQSKNDCIFSFNKHGQVTCTKQKFTPYGYATKKCPDFPCSFYENIVKSIRMIHEGADQFGIIPEKEKEKPYANKEKKKNR